MPYITILEENEPFDWTVPLEDGTPSETKFRLVALGEDVKRALRKKHSRITFKHGQRVDEFNSDTYADDVLTQAVLGWTGLMAQRAGKREEVAFDLAVVKRLPHRLKSEILTMCVGAEAARGSEGDEPTAEGADPNAR